MTRDNSQPPDLPLERRVLVRGARTSLSRVRVRWFEDSVHDLHIQRPDELSQEILGALRDGFFGW